MSAKEPRVQLNGGLFHTTKVQYSKETHALLKQLIEESKLSIKQRRLLHENIKNGDPLPVSQNTPSNKKTLKKDDILVPPFVSKRRSLNTILNSGAYEREKFYALHNIGNSQKEKLRLQSLMTYGKEVNECVDKIDKSKINPKEQFQESNLDELFDYLLEGVKERLEFLKDMKALGEDTAYRTIIQQEIASRLRQMEKISPEKFNSLDL